MICSLPFEFFKQLKVGADANVGGSDVAPANHNVRNKHTVASRQNVVSLMILLKL